MRGRAFRILISLLVSLGFLWLAVRNVDWGRVVDAFAGVQYGYVLPILAMTVWTLIIRAQRWRMLLARTSEVPLRPLITATNVGFMANMVLPLRAGEVIRPVLVSRSQGLPLSGLLATILLERVFDMLTVLAMFGIGALVVPFSEEVRQWGVIFTGIAVVATGGLAAIRWQEEAFLGMARNLAGFLPARIREPVLGFSTGFVRALDVLESPRSFARAFAWSLYLWVVIAAIYALGLMAFDLDVPYAIGSVVVVAIIAIVIAIPSAPGYIGPFQVGCLVGLGIFGVGESVALAFSVVLHLTQFVGTIGAGLYSLWTENVSFREVESLAESEGEAVAEQEPGAQPSDGKGSDRGESSTS